MHQHDYDVPCYRLLGAVYDNQVTVTNTSAGHRMAVDAHDTGSRRMLDKPLAKVDRLLEVVGRR